MGAGDELKKVGGIVVGVGLAVGVTVFAVWLVNYGISIYTSNQMLTAP